MLCALRMSGLGFRAHVCLHRCWSGEHLAVGVLAVAGLLLLVLGMPLFSFVYIRNRLRGAISFRCNESGNVTGCADVLVLAQVCACALLMCECVCACLCAVGAWRGFVDGDYKLKRFYFRHAGWLVQALVLALNEFVPITTGPRAGAVAVC
jgi:hypothetical protein